MVSPRSGIRVTPDEPQADNRRRHGRIRCDMATCELGSVINLSASGIMIRTSKALKEGEDVAFWIEGPDARFTVSAKVIRSTKKSWFRYEAALQFESLSDEARAGLTEIARLAATQQEVL